MISFLELSFSGSKHVTMVRGQIKTFVKCLNATQKRKNSFVSQCTENISIFHEIPSSYGVNSFHCNETHKKDEKTFWQDFVSIQG